MVATGRFAGLDDPMERAHATLNWCAPMLGVDWFGEPDDCDRVVKVVAKWHEIVSVALDVEGEGRQDGRVRPSLLTRLSAAVQDAQERGIALHGAAPATSGADGAGVAVPRWTVAVETLDEFHLGTMEHVVVRDAGTTVVAVAASDDTHQRLRELVDAANAGQSRNGQSA
jgi:hypothetical protein